jgi:hypothetical protein
MQVKFPRKLPVTSRPYRLCDEKSIRRYGGRMQGKGETRRTGSTRREIMTAAGASALALSVGAGLSNPPVMATGRVFEDRSGSGRRGPRDPGIADVMVSNGHNVVRTDVDGHWRLPIEDGDSVFVIKPPHWSTSVGPSGLPQFSCLYQPQGSPGDVHYYHPGVAPTGELPSSIDFGLRRREESRQFEALLLADTQPANDVELAYLRDDIMASIAGSGAAFAINHGDVVFDDLDLYARYLQIIGATGIPWHHCPGNHDINWDAHDDRWSRETWKRVFGPRHYAFQHADATFILLDNVHYTGRKPGSAQAGKYLGRIGDDQLRFVRNVLAHVPPEQLVIISMHIPLATYQDPTNPSDNTVDCAALLALLAGRSRAVSFSGHMHLTEHTWGHRRITIMSWRPRPADGGAALPIAAAYRWPTAPTAPPTASTRSKWTVRITRRGSYRRRAKRSAACASLSTAPVSAACAMSPPATGVLWSGSMRSLPVKSSSMSSMVVRARASFANSPGRLRRCRCSGRWPPTPSSSSCSHDSRKCRGRGSKRFRRRISGPRQFLNACSPAPTG